MHKNPNKLIIIGTSAFGNLAVPYLISQINVKNSAIIISPHIDHKEIKESLSKKGISYSVITNQLPIESGKIYFDATHYKESIIFENNYFTIFDSNDYNQQIDSIFTNATKEFKENVLGVILTGASNDGFEGAKEIKSNGGTVIAQFDPYAKNIAVDKIKFDNFRKLKQAVSLYDKIKSFIEVRKNKEYPEYYAGGMPSSVINAKLVNAYAPLVSLPKLVQKYINQ